MTATAPEPRAMEYGEEPQKKTSNYIVQRNTVDGWVEVPELRPGGPTAARRLVGQLGKPGEYRVLKIMDEFEVVERQQPVYEVR